MVIYCICAHIYGVFVLFCVDSVLLGTRFDIVFLSFYAKTNQVRINAESDASISQRFKRFIFFTNLVPK